MKRKYMYIVLFIVSLFYLCGCKKKETANLIDIKLNNEIVLNNIAEITFTDIGYTEEISPPISEGSYFHYLDQPNEKYILLKGKFKNLLNKQFNDLLNFSGVLKINNKYEYNNVIIVFATDNSSDFFQRPNPLETMNVYIWITLSDNIILDNNNEYVLYLDFINDDNNEKITLKLPFDMLDINDISRILQSYLGIDKTEANRLKQAFNKIGINYIGAISKDEYDNYIVAYRGTNLSNYYNVVNLIYNSSVISIGHILGCPLYYSGIDGTTIWGTIEKCDKNIAEQKEKWNWPDYG